MAVLCHTPHPAKVFSLLFNYLVAMLSLHSVSIWAQFPPTNALPNITQAPQSNNSNLWHEVRQKCSFDNDCAKHDPCMVYWCEQHRCYMRKIYPVQLETCRECLTHSDCDDGLGCTVDVCEGGLCSRHRSGQNHQLGEETVTEVEYLNGGGPIASVVGNYQPDCDCTTFSYVMSMRCGTYVPSFRYWTLGTDCSREQVLEVQPAASFIGFDPITGIHGIRFDQGLGPCSEQKFTVRMRGHVTAGPNLVAVRAYQD
eukprot:gene12791-521_t